MSVTSAEREIPVESHGYPCKGFVARRLAGGGNFHVTPPPTEDVGGAKKGLAVSAVCVHCCLL